MDKEKRKNSFKGGAEKLRLKRNAELKAAGNDPKQTKLSFLKGKYILVNYYNYKYTAQLIYYFVYYLICIY